MYTSCVHKHVRVRIIPAETTVVLCMQLVLKTAMSESESSNWSSTAPLLKLGGKERWPPWSSFLNCTDAHHNPRAAPGGFTTPESCLLDRGAHPAAPPAVPAGQLAQPAPASSISTALPPDQSQARPGRRAAHAAAARALADAAGNPPAGPCSPSQFPLSPSCIRHSRLRWADLQPTVNHAAQPSKSTIK